MKNVIPSLKHIICPDIPELDKKGIDSEHEICVLVQALIGPQDHEGYESFEFVVCNGIWVTNRIEDDIVVGKNKIFLKHFILSDVEDVIRRIILSCAGPSWDDVAVKISRYGLWEFEDYVE